MSIIGDLIKYYRKQLNMSQNDLCGEECSRRSLINIENGRNTPSLETIALLSEKLKVNLFGAYCAVYAHNNLETHLICRKIDRALSREDYTEMERLIEEADKSPGFITGEPRQLLCYLKGLVHFHRGEYEESRIQYEEAIRTRHSNFPSILFDETTYNNKEYAMLMAYAVTMSKMGRKPVSIDILRQEEAYVANLLRLEDYFDDGTKGCLSCIRCSCILNEYCDTEEADGSLLDRIEEIVDRQKETKRIHLLPELLFCKAAILMKSKMKDSAIEIYRTAYTIAEFYYGKEKAHILAEEIINVHSNYLLFTNEE